MPPRLQLASLSVYQRRSPETGPPSEELKCFPAIPPAIYLWHNPGGMGRCLLALVLGCSALLAQEPVSPPSTDFNAPQSWFQWKKFASVQPRALALSMPAPQGCSVPLLAAPVDPNVDVKMPLLKEPAESLDHMPVAKGLPPCPSHDSQPEVRYILKPRVTRPR